MPPGPTKVRTFSDDTLFYMFYSYPRDALQELAAQELCVLLLFSPSRRAHWTGDHRWNRSWRFHKEQRVWLTKDGGVQASQKVPGGETGAWIVFDPEAWARDRKEATVLYADLEDKVQPAFPPAMTLPQAVAALQQSTQQAPVGVPQAQARGYGTMAAI